MAKVVVVELDRRPAMVLVAAGSRVDLRAAAQLAGATEARLADELTCAGAFPDCEAGAQPAMGNLYQLPVYVDHLLGRQPMIVFNAGTHTRAIRMAWRDFARMVKPRLGRLSEAPMTAAAAI